MTNQTQKQKWIFAVIDFEENELFINEKGEQIDRDDAIPFIGDDTQAEQEGDRRAILWEEKYDAVCSDIKQLSLGVVEDASDS